MKTSNTKISSEDRQKYVLATDQDVQILEKCKELEALNLSPSDRNLVIFIKTQLEEDWRTPLSEKLGVLLRKYKP